MQRVDEASMSSSPAVDGANDAIGNAAVALRSSEAACATAATAADVVTVWAGEWPYVKQGVRDTRVAVTSTYAWVRRAVDMTAYTTRARAVGRAMDARLTRLGTRVQSSLQQHSHWLLPTAAIASCSVFVAVRSAAWGVYAMARNGLLTSALLLTLCYPQELLRVVDAALPFSTARYAAVGVGLDKAVVDDDTSGTSCQ